jgi:hypothetical protein
MRIYWGYDEKPIFFRDSAETLTPFRNRLQVQMRNEQP